MFAQEESEARQPPTREDLILQHLPQVKLIARQVSERLPISISLDDLISAGTVGLIAAIDRYDPHQHVKLRTYAEYKIRGAILDSLRSTDWAPRQQRRRRRMIERAIEELEQQLSRAPTEEEIAGKLQISLKDYRDWLNALRSLSIGSLEVSHEEGGERLLNFLADDRGQSPVQVLEQAELQNLLRKAIESLPTLEQNVLSFYFYEDLTLREIAGILNLHESRISQLKSQAILRVRAAMSSALRCYCSRSEGGTMVTDNTL